MVEIERTALSPARDAATARLLAAAVAGMALCLFAIAFALSNAAPDHRVLSVVLHGLLVAAPVGTGLWALGRASEDRFPWLLVAAGTLGSLTVLAESGDATVYSIGRVSIWLLEPVVVYLLLAFPSGRLSSSGDRAVVIASVLVVGLLYLPTALVTPQFPVPSPWAACDTDCPRNAFALTGSEPSIVADVIRPVREVVTVVVFAAAAALLARRIGCAGPLGRRVLLPVAATACYRTGAITAYFIARPHGTVSPAVDAIGWLFALSLPIIALGFFGGLLARALHSTAALRRLMLRLGPHTTPTELRAGMAEALEDPALRVVYSLPGEPGQWVDDTGWPVEPPEARPGTAVTEVRAHHRRVAAIIHDPLLAQDPALLEATAAYASVMLENNRLLEQLRTSLSELSESRARVVTVADEARRGIERDLHDGAQQRLIALRIRLGVAAERLQDVAPETAPLLEKLGSEVEETIDDVRALAGGIYPPVLASQGLAGALRAAAVTSPLPTSVEVDGIGRYGPQIETTVYFACVEALQNAVKHARGATGVSISLAADGALHFEIRDDGAGFEAADTVRGAGLTNLRDRVAAVGGELNVESVPDRGTRVAGSVPLQH
jgi:signal transduction histidine kinase